MEAWPKKVELCSKKWYKNRDYFDQRHFTIPFSKVQMRHFEQFSNTVITHLPVPVILDANQIGAIIEISTRTFLFL